jgi:hypothetical protein
VATLVLSTGKVADIIDKTREKSQSLVTVDLSEAVNATSAVLDKTALSQLADAGLGLELQLPQGSVALSPEALRSAAAQASGSNVSFSEKAAAAASLNARQQATVKTAAVYDVSVISNGSEIVSFGGGLITVALPYTLRSGENPAGASVWRLDGDGGLQKMDAAYDALTGRTVFTTDHLSLYMTGYEAPAAEAKPWVNPFGDVKESDWFYGDVAYAHANGLFGGTGADTFSPGAPMSRGMLVTVVGRLAGANVGGYAGASSFSDVFAAQYYAPYIAWAYAGGIVGGTGGGAFSPDAPVSRQDLAVVLMNYVKLTGKSLPQKQGYSSFADGAGIASYARPAVEAVYQAGIIGGKPGGLFDPRGSATRAEVAAILRRFIETAQP